MIHDVLASLKTGKDVFLCTSTALVTRLLIIKNLCLEVRSARMGPEQVMRTWNSTIRGTIVTFVKGGQLHA